MPLICQCPKCGEPVTIPDGLPQETLVRCPLCQATFPLQQALATLPPALIPLGQPEDPAATPGEPADRIEELTEDRVELVDDGPQADANPLAGLAIETGHRQGDSAVSSRLARSRTTSGAKGGVRFLVEVFMGGFVGLSIAYYAISWLLPQNGLPKLPLPLLPHTMHWLDGATEPEPNTRPTPPRETRHGLPAELLPGGIPPNAHDFPPLEFPPDPVDAPSPPPTEPPPTEPLAQLDVPPAALSPPDAPPESLAPDNP